MREMKMMCVDATKKVWDVEDKVEPVDKDAYGETGDGRPAGADGVFWDSQMEAGNKKEPPIMKEWQSLGVLDEGLLH